MTGIISDRLPTGEPTMMQTIKLHTHKLLSGVLAAGCFFAASLSPVYAADNASGNTLQAVDFAELPGNKTQITLTLSKPAPAPLSFTIDNPARIALDFPDTSNGLEQRSQNIGIGMTESLTAVEAQGRTRVVVNLFPTKPMQMATRSFLSYKMPAADNRTRLPSHHMQLAATVTPSITSTFVAAKMARAGSSSVCQTHPYR